MGGVDDEPPAKRVKHSLLELNSLPNNSSHNEHFCSLKGFMARPLPLHGKEEIVGTKGIIKRAEFVRIITKALFSIGYERSGAMLEEESGIPLHTPDVNLFRKQLLDGNWKESLITLHNISIKDENILKSSSFLIMEQKFFELVSKGRIMDALNTLRSELSSLSINAKRLHELAGCIVSPSRCSILGFNKEGDGIASSRLKLLQELQKLLPPTIMIPEGRLEQLVEQALNVQKEACIFHNSLDSSLSLYSDHQCGREKIPSQSLQVLHSHSDDIWFLQFSNNGKYLASSSRDKTAVIWEVHDSKVKVKHTLSGHDKPVMMVAWSPDDVLLLTCGQEEVVRCWDVHSGDCLQVYEKSGLTLISCGWLPDGKTIVTGVSDRSVCIWDLDGKELECWKGQRTIMISDVAVTVDSKWIITICKETKILMFDRHSRAETEIEEDNSITSFSLSRDNKFLLLNLLNQEIHLWRIEDDPRLIARYKGHKRSRFVIRSCFGGIEQAFIASGSEDSQVYIWHRSTGELVSTLPGHSGSVNCVSWNPANPHMLASASDDRTVRIWGLNNTCLKQKNGLSNGVVYCNGTSKWQRIESQQESVDSQQFLGM